ncbi:MAG: PAS domain-containing protein [Burkholderiales bacterium]
MNAAAQDWADALGLRAEDVWPTLAAEWRAAVGGSDRGRLVAPPLCWRSVALDDGWLVWFATAEGERAPMPWRSAADKLALVQDFVAIGVFERDLRTYEARWDAQMFRHFGFPPGMKSPPMAAAIENVHPDDRERFRSEHERFLREGGRHSLRYRVVWPDGSKHDLRSLVEIRKDASGTPELMIGVIIDDSEGVGQVRAEQAINAHLAQALHIAEVAVWRVDFAAHRMHINQIGYEMLGASPRPDGVDLDEVRSWAHPDDRLRIVQAAEDAALIGGIVDVEVRYRDRHGGYRPVLTRRVAERDEYGQAIGLLGVAIDQTVQAAERERIQALLRRIELVADAADLGIWSADGEDGALEWNEQMYRIYGIGRDRLPGSMRAWRETLVHADDRARMSSSRERAVLAGEKDFEAEFRIVRPDGTVRWVVSRSRREEQGGRALLIGIHLDTTDLVVQRRLAEQALHEKEVALRASQAKSEFLSRASHELRTPLNAVLGFAQLIEHEGLLAPAALQLDRVARIRSAGEHLLAMVDDVLDLAAIESGSLVVTLEPVCIDEILRDAAQWLASLAERGGVTIHLRPCGGWVLADARRLRQIVANLLSNAVKFNRPGGSVWLSSVRCDAAAGPTWQIRVRDDGRGLEAAQQAHLFEAFDRLGVEREGIDGVGLGLVIARQLATLMDGRIEVSSAPGQGSEFRVTLAAAAALGPPAAPEVPDAKPFEVLYIEDNPVNVVLVEGLVALRPGVTLRCAVDGVSGVEMALAHRPDMVLIDMQLPDIDGYEVRRRLRAATSLDASRLIALSANGLTDDIERALAAGFDDYWTKPIDFKLFLGRLDEMVAHAVR